MFPTKVLVRRDPQQLEESQVRIRPVYAAGHGAAGLLERNYEALADVDGSESRHAHWALCHAGGCRSISRVGFDVRAKFRPEILICCNCLHFHLPDTRCNGWKAGEEDRHQLALGTAI